MAEATWPLRRRPRTLDRHHRDDCGELDGDLHSSDLIIARMPNVRARARARKAIDRGATLLARRGRARCDALTIDDFQSF